MDRNSTRITSVVVHVEDDHDMDALSHTHYPDGSVFIGSEFGRLQLSGTPDQLRSFAKAIEDGAIEIERQIAEREAPDAA